MGTIDLCGKVVALCGWTKRGAPPEMPFADVAGAIACFFKGLCHGDRVLWQGHGCLRRDDAFEGAPMTGNVRGDADARLVLARLNGAT